MNFVEPIRDRKKIAQIKNLLRGQRRSRDLLLFVVWINTAQRISDLLQLQVNHFLDEQGPIKRRFWIKERKRGKHHEIVINASIREALDEYLGAYPDIVDGSNNFVFFNSSTNDYSLPIKRGQAWKFITSVCREASLSGNFGTHSLRKTWGYHARMNGVDLALIIHKLNHESIAYTKRYLGITDDELEAVAQRLNLLWRCIMLCQKAREFRQHESISLEDLVPDDNFYRQVEQSIDIDFECSRLI